MELVLLFILSGTISWGLSALLLLAIMHALGRAVASGASLPQGARPPGEGPS